MRGGGIPVLTYLRDNGYLADEKIRMVILTASDRPADLSEALNLGAISYLIKSPFSDSLINQVRRFCGS